MASIEIISIQIPNTVGTTFKDLLLRIYGKEGVLVDDQDGIMDPCSTFNLDPVAALSVS